MRKKTIPVPMQKTHTSMPHKLRLFLWQANRCLAIQSMEPPSFNWRQLCHELGHSEEDALQIVADLYRMGYISFSDRLLDHMILTKLGKESQG